MKISWYKNNAPIIMSQRHTTHYDELKKVCALKIKNAKRDDFGVYTVVVENPYGSDQSSGQVSVIFPEENRPRQPSVPASLPSPVVKAPQPLQEEMKAPRILKHLQPETNVNEDQPVILSCMIEGSPLPQVKFNSKYSFYIFLYYLKNILSKITYLKNEQPLPVSSRIKTSFNPNNGLVTIRIEDVNVYDSGAYKVRAENPAGRAETAGVVYVQKAPVIDTRPVVDPDAFKYLPQSNVPAYKPVEPKPHTPHVTTPINRDTPSESDIPMHEYVPPNFIVGLPANCKIHEGEPIKLNCQVEGNPKPSVYIFLISFKLP